MLISTIKINTIIAKKILLLFVLSLIQEEVEKKYKFSFKSKLIMEEY